MTRSLILPGRIAKKCCMVHAVDCSGKLVARDGADNLVCCQCFAFGEVGGSGSLICGGSWRIEGVFTRRCCCSDDEQG